MAQMTQKAFRIGLFGNVCNMLYQMAKALRACSEIQPELYIDHTAALQDNPISDDGRLAREPASWIHYGNYMPARWFVSPWKSPLVSSLAHCDLIIASGQGPMIAQFAQKPMVLFAMGGDLTVDPFPLRFLYLYPGIKDKLGLLCKGYWQRRALQRTREFWVQCFYPNLNALTRLGIKPENVSPQYFPVVIDTAMLSSRASPKFLSPVVLPIRKTEASFLVFHPSRIQMDDYARKGAEGQSKRNDLLLKGYTKFCRAVPDAYTRLVLIERSASMDLPKAKRLINDLGISDRVVWLKASREQGFSREEMADIYSHVDVVADQFSDVGWFGNVTLEACACSRPVITRVNEAVVSKMYPRHPLLHAANEDEIADQLLRLYKNRKWRIAQGQLSRKWVETFHSYETAGPLYVARLHKLLNNNTNRPYAV